MTKPEIAVGLRVYIGINHRTSIWSRVPRGVVVDGSAGWVSTPSGPEFKGTGSGILVKLTDGGEVIVTSYRSTYKEEVWENERDKKQRAYAASLRPELRGEELAHECTRLLAAKLGHHRFICVVDNDGGILLQFENSEDFASVVLGLSS